MNVVRVVILVVDNTEHLTLFTALDRHCHIGTSENACYIGNNSRVVVVGL